MNMDPIPLAANPNLLFHYTTWEIASSYILPNSELRLSPYGKTNDPRENRSWSFQLSDDLNLPEGHTVIKSFADNQKVFTDVLKSRVKLMCFAQDGTTPGAFKQRMWSQYADGHSGVCIVFDKDKLTTQFSLISQNSKLSRHDAVTYDRKAFIDRRQYDAFTFASSELLNVDFAEACDRKIEAHWKIYYFSKEQDWMTENEYRFICMDETEENLYVPTADSIEAIVLGVDFDSKRMNLLSALIRSQRKPVPVYRLMFTNNAYMLFEQELS